MADLPVALVTGARKGIGRFLAERFLDQGYSVIGCSRQANDLQSPRYTHFELDVADEKAIDGMLLNIRKDQRRLDVLVNNAGIMATNSALLTAYSTVERVMSTNFHGTFLLCRGAVRLMQRRGWGRIVNFATIATPLKVEGESIYAASKAAVVSFTQILAKEVAAMGITVNAVAPSLVKTDIIESLSEERTREILSRQALPQFAEMADVANVVDFFIRPESGFVTGQVLYLGGV